MFRFIFEPALIYHPGISWFKKFIGTKREYNISIEVVFEGVRRTERFFSNPSIVSIDLTDVRPLLSETGKITNWYDYRGTIYCAVPYCSDRPHVKTRADLSSYVIPDNSWRFQYLIDANHVFNHGRVMREISPEHFRIFNPCFAGDKMTILTHFGNAKVVCPWEFEALDNGKVLGDHSPAGHGRDGRHAYWFGTNDKAHATVVRACKHPPTFVSMGNGYAKDRDRIYHWYSQLPKSDPQSWHMLNNYYSKDARHVYFENSIVPGADPKTFVVVPDSHEDSILDSIYGHDSRNTYKRVSVVTSSDSDIFFQ